MKEKTFEEGEEYFICNVCKLPFEECTKKANELYYPKIKFTPEEKFKAGFDTQRIWLSKILEAAEDKIDRIATWDDAVIVRKICKMALTSLDKFESELEKSYIGNQKDS